jgi:hypothetical protein
LEAARYEAGLACRQYQQVDPDNRLHAIIHWHGGDHTALDVATKVRGV